jgi:broad specificity phosphatase PhoE
LRQENIRCVYSSDLRRASEFASIAARDTPVKIMSGLREINFGIFEGLSHRQILKKYPRLYRAWLRDPQNTTLPQGEGLFSLRVRVKKALREIRARNKTGSVAVISHAGPIKTILKEFIPDATFWDIRVDNGSLSIIEYQKNKPKLLLHNDTSFCGGKP